jgi:hypothetical protein
MFAASDHLITLDRGTIEAPGTTIDLALNPISVMGTGSGSVSIAPLGGDLYEALFTLPVQFNEAFEVMNVPIVGTVTGNIQGSGTFVARQQFMLTSLPGDYDFDGDLDCDDIDLLQSAILTGSTNLLFDVNGDGMVTLPDYQAWVTDLKETLPGDADLDFSVDGSDFNSWNAHKFTSDRGWCQGDFSGDGTVDGTDFNTWNANKFTSAEGTGSQVPEPPGTVLGLCGILLFICTNMRLTNVHISG